jgi:riboflavin synthase
VFTGLVEEQGTIEAVTPRGEGGVRLVIRSEEVLEELSIGESLAVDGVCLTAVEASGGTVTVDLSEETLRRTILGSKTVGSRCNIELPLRLDARLGGHLVTGHIDAVGEVADVRPEAGSSWVTIEAPPEVMRYIVPKGSVAVDGVSLTVAACAEGSFSVSIIPHTAQVTTFGAAQVGTPVNIEADLIGKYVERLLAGRFGEEVSGPADLAKDFIVRHDLVE